MRKVRVQTQFRPYSLWAVTGGRLRMRDWPSIVPGAPEDYYLVVNHYGRFGIGVRGDRPRSRQLMKPPSPI